MEFFRFDVGEIWKSIADSLLKGSKWVLMNFGLKVHLVFLLWGRCVCDLIGCVEMTFGGGQFAHLKKDSRIQIISYFVFFSTSFYSCITALAFFYTNKVVTLCHLCNFSFLYLPLCSLFGTIKMNFVKKKMKIHGMKLQKDTKRDEECWNLIYRLICRELDG